MVFVLQFTFVEAAKLESGVTVNPIPTSATEKICDDGKDNNNNGKFDADDQDCASVPSSPVEGSCELQIISGAPVNYGQINVGQTSAEQKVTIKNEGTSQTPAKFMIKGGDWISDAAGNPTISGPEITHVSLAPNMQWSNLKRLTSTGWELGQMTGGQSIPIYFQFKVPVGVPSGSFHQDVTIDLLC